MQTPHLMMQKLRIFRSPHGQGGQFFAILCGRSLWTPPKINAKVFPNPAYKNH